MDENIKLKLLAGLPLLFGNVCKVYPLKLIEIAEMGCSDYNYVLNILLIDPSQVKFAEGVDPNSKETFDIIDDYIKYEGQEYKQFLIFALSLFVKEEVSLYNGEIYIGDISEHRVICKDNYEEFKKILMFQNCLDNTIKQNPPTFTSEKQKEIFQKLAAGRKRNEQENSFNLISTVNAVLHTSNGLITYDNLSTKTIYQIYNTFESVIKYENYQKNFDQALAGCDLNKLDLTHWSKLLRK